MAAVPPAWKVRAAMQWTTATIRIPDVPLLTLAEVATAVGYSTKTLRKWIAEGRFPAPAQVGDGERWTAYSVGVWLAWQDFVGRLTRAEIDPAPTRPSRANDLEITGK